MNGRICVKPAPGRRVLRERRGVALPETWTEVTPSHYYRAALRDGDLLLKPELVPEAPPEGPAEEASWPPFPEEDEPDAA